VSRTHSMRGRTAIGGDWGSPVDKHVELFSALSKSAPAFATTATMSAFVMLPPCRRHIPRTFHELHHARVYVACVQRTHCVTGHVNIESRGKGGQRGIPKTMSRAMTTREVAL